jgi:hypothetical protein
MVLAYRVRFAEPTSRAPDTDWTPGEFGDDELKDHVGSRTFNQARRVRAAGYSATVHRAGSDDSTVRVDLPQSTVRFMVPHRLEHARTSAADHTAGVSIVLAVWAVREADRRGTDVVHVGEQARHPRAAVIAAAHDVVSTVLAEGTAHLTPTLLASLRRSASTLTAADAIWLGTAAAELMEQLGAYQTRHNGYSRRRVSELLVEIDARARLSASDQPFISYGASGVGVPGETPIGRATLTALGARVARLHDTVAVDVYFFDRRDLTVSVWRRTWDGDSPHHIGGERVLSTTIQSLAAANVVTESAVRLASNQIRFARKGIGRTSILPLQAADWTHLGSRVYKDDYASVRADLLSRMPSYARPRVDTPTTFVFEIAKVSRTDYLPGAQTLSAEVRDSLGNCATVRSDYRAEAPGALDTIADALRSATAVSGRAWLSDGMLIIDPLAIGTETTIFLPQLARPSAPSILRRAPARSPERLVDTINAAIEVISDLAHHGLEHPRSNAPTLIEQAAQTVLGVGMTITAGLIDELADALVSSDAHRRRTAWLAAATQLTTAAEFA